MTEDQVFTEQANEFSGAKLCEFPIKGQSNDNVDAKTLQQLDSLIKASEIEHGYTRAKRFPRASAKGNDGALEATASRLFYGMANDILVAAMNAIKGADGQDRSLGCMRALELLHRCNCH
jgi:hypothetical protein